MPRDAPKTPPFLLNASGLTSPVVSKGSSPAPHPANHDSDMNSASLPLLPAQLPHTLQELSPKQAKLCLNIANTMQKQYGLSLSQQRILVGFSGGTDSLALLIILRILAKAHNFHFVAAHLHHSLRATATAEAAWCEQLCATFAIPFYTETLDVPALMQEINVGVEEAARCARYAFYERALKAHACTWVALGHHANDLAEDVLMRLVRGTGWPALAGMQGICHKRKVFRPLLHVSKTQLADFLAEVSLQPLEDLSNNDPTFLRNRVRMHILPLFEQENPRFLEHIDALWQLGQLDGDYFTLKMQELAKSEAEYLKNNAKKLPLYQKSTKIELIHTTALEPLRAQHRTLRLRFLKHTLEQLGGQALNTTLFALDETIFGSQFPKTIQFSHKIRVMVVKNVLFWLKET